MQDSPNAFAVYLGGICQQSRQQKSFCKTAWETPRLDEIDKPFVN